MTATLALRYAALVFLATQAAALLRADGGALQLREQAGPYVISVFTTPSLPRAGPVDFSVLLQATGALTPVLDAQVEIAVRDDTGVVISRSALHDNAQNHLFYAAILTLPHEGLWTCQITVRQSAATATAAGSLQVFTESSPLATHWRALAFPFVFLFLFALHQALTARQRRQYPLRRATVPR